MRSMLIADFAREAGRFKKQCCVYELHWEGKSYIGSSVNLKSRMGWWERTLPKNAKGRVLLVCEPTDREYYEEALIAKFKTAINGHNKTHTGKAGAVPGHAVSDKTKEAISCANTGKRRTAEAKAKMSAAAVKRGAHSAEVYAKIAAANTGKKRSLEVRAILSAQKKGKKFSEEHKAALRAAWVRRKANKERTNG